MSPEAIDRRLRELNQLYRLWMEISKARWLGPLAPGPQSRQRL
jgi:hypothetical protein